jgi:hypothetical protein
MKSEALLLKKLARETEGIREELSEIKGMLKGKKAGH